VHCQTVSQRTSLSASTGQRASALAARFLATNDTQQTSMAYDFVSWHDSDDGGGC